MGLKGVREQEVIGGGAEPWDSGKYHLGLPLGTPGETVPEGKGLVQGDPFPTPRGCSHPMSPSGALPDLQVWVRVSSHLLVGGGRGLRVLGQLFPNLQRSEKSGLTCEVCIFQCWEKQITTYQRLKN